MTGAGSVAHGVLVEALGRMLADDGAHLIGSRFDDWASGSLRGERHQFAFGFDDAIRPFSTAAIAARIDRQDFGMAGRFVADTVLSLDAQLIRIEALTIAD